LYIVENFMTDNITSLIEKSKEQIHYIPETLLDDACSDSFLNFEDYLTKPEKHDEENPPDLHILGIKAISIFYICNFSERI
jgi:hypothetical protein